MTSPLAVPLLVMPTTIILFMSRGHQDGTRGIPEVQGQEQEQEQGTGLNPVR